MILLIVIDPKGLHSSSFFPAIVVLFECKCKEHLSHCFQHLEKVMIHRQQQYSEFRKLIAMRAKYFFIVLLSNRNYTGKMSFNHSKETLEMNVSLVWILFQALIHQCSLTPKCWAYQFLSFGCLIFTSLINIPPSLVLLVYILSLCMLVTFKIIGSLWRFDVNQTGCFDLNKEVCFSCVSVLLIYQSCFSVEYKT